MAAMLGSRTLLAVDIGGSFTRATLMRREAPPALIVTASTPRGPANLCATVAALKRQLESTLHLSADGIALAIASVVHPSNGIVEKSLKFGIDDSTDLSHALELATGLRGIVRTELSMAARGEMEQPDAPENLVVMTIGTGLGAGVIVGRRPYLGSTGCAGEIGHIQIAKGSLGRPCSCGRRGCLEAYAASRSVTRLVGVGAWDKPEEAAAAAAQGDQRALNAFRETGRFIGLAASICVNTYDPDKVILRGGFVRAVWPFICDALMAQFVESSLRPDIRLDLSRYGDNGVFVGLHATWMASGVC